MIHGNEIVKGHLIHERRARKNRMVMLMNQPTMSQEFYVESQARDSHSTSSKPRINHKKMYLTSIFIFILIILRRSARPAL